MTDDRVRFLRDRYDEEERIALDAPRGPWTMDDAGSVVDADGRRVILAVGGALDGRVSRWPEGPVVDHIVRHDPARVLADVEAKRALIARGGPFCTSGCDEPGNEPKDPATNWTTPLEHHLDCAAYKAAKALALPYVDHEEFKDGWRT